MKMPLAMASIPPAGADGHGEQPGFETDIHVRSGLRRNASGIGQGALQTGPERRDSANRKRTQMARPARALLRL
jgi:hypothetical protein